MGYYEWNCRVADRNFGLFLLLQFGQATGIVLGIMGIIKLLVTIF